MSGSTLATHAAKKGVCSPAVERIIDALVERFNGIRKAGAIRCTCPFCGFLDAKFDIRRKKLVCKACRHVGGAGAARDYWHQAEENGSPIPGRHSVGIGELAKKLRATLELAGSEGYHARHEHELTLVGETEDPVQSATEDELERIAREVELNIDSMRQTAIETAVSIGHQLREAQHLLAGQGRDGEFRPWLKQRLQISHTTAYKWIALADFSQKCQSGLHLFELSAAYLLTSSKCPEEATEEAIDLAVSGVRITPKLAREIVEKYATCVVPTDTARIDAAVTRIRTLGNSLAEPLRASFVDLLRQLADEIEHLDATENGA